MSVLDAVTVLSSVGEKRSPNWCGVVNPRVFPASHIHFPFDTWAIPSLKSYDTYVKPCDTEAGIYRIAQEDGMWKTCGSATAVPCAIARRGARSDPPWAPRAATSITAVVVVVVTLIASADEPSTCRMCVLRLPPRLAQCLSE